MECRKCGGDLAVLGTYGKDRGVCRGCHRVRVYARRDALKAEGKCTGCQQPHNESGPYCADCKEKNLQRYYDNHEAYRETAKQRRRGLKREVVEAYSGGACECCNEREIEFLTIDHVLGNGAEHRRQLKEEKGWDVPASSMAGSHFYLWLKQNNFPPGFRVLCQNCNSSYGHFGYCPHQRKLQLVQETGS